MTEPKLEIEKRVDRLEMAVRTLVRNGFGAQDVEEIENILAGENPEKPPEPEPQEVSQEQPQGAQEDASPEG